MIVTIQDFVSKPYAIPNLDEHEEEFLEFATNLEREILPKILGPLLYNTMIAGAFNPDGTFISPLPTQWDKLINGESYLVDNVGYRWVGLKSILKPYIWFHWVRENHELLTDSGTVQLAEENATRISPKRKLCRAYNDFVSKCGHSHLTERMLWNGYGSHFNTLYGFINYWTGFAYVGFSYNGLDELQFINEWDL